MVNGTCLLQPRSCARGSDSERRGVWYPQVWTCLVSPQDDQEPFTTASLHAVHQCHRKHTRRSWLSCPSKKRIPQGWSRRISGSKCIYVHVLTGKSSNNLPSLLPILSPPLSLSLPLPLFLSLSLQRIYETSTNRISHSTLRSSRSTRRTISRRSNNAWRPSSLISRMQNNQSYMYKYTCVNTPYSTQ